jgi:predicted nucleic acid-binding protein
MNIIDSSFWLEYFAGTKAGDIISDIIEETNQLIVPTITIYEVFKKLMLERNEDDALLAIGHMKQGKIVNLTDELSLDLFDNSVSCLTVLAFFRVKPYKNAFLLRSCSEN